MKRKEVQHPFYRPLWRRIAICTVVAAWALFEIFAGGDPIWIVITLGLLGYSVWIFLISFPKPEDNPPG